MYDKPFNPIARRTRSGLSATFGVRVRTMNKVACKACGVSSLATRNARTRADEFAKNGGVTVGSMRSASQGAFYILAPGSTAESSEYGGIYDKSTVNKIARVVVTIDYNIER
jgi:hypothetical protein